MPTPPPLQPIANSSDKETANSSAKGTVNSPAKITVDSPGKSAVDSPPKITVDSPAKGAVDSPAQGTVDTVDSPAKTTVDFPAKTTVDSSAKTCVNSPAKTTVDSLTKTAVDSHAKGTVDSPAKGVKYVPGKGSGDDIANHTDFVMPAAADDTRYVVYPRNFLLLLTQCDVNCTSTNYLISFITYSYNSESIGLSSPVCSWVRSFTGCVNRTQAPILCDHGKSGCGNTLHHNCGSEWEFAQYRKENPNGAPGDCPYDSEGKKYCIECHPHSALALADTDNAEDEM